jgi:ribbon-helix-helix CopG family protein
VKLPPRLAAKVARLARQRRTTRSEIVREAVEKLEPGAAKGSFLELASRYCGSFRGPGDLSTNPKYLSDLGE